MEDRRTDGQLIALSRTEPEAFNEIFSRYAVRVHAFLARRSNRQIADDLLGEVFLTAFRARGRFDTGAEVATPWLYGVAHNVLRARLRADGRGRALLHRAPVPPASTDPWDRTSERIDADRHKDLLTAALASLPPAEREVVQLVAWEDLTPTEAAAVLGIPGGTARSRLHRARAGLRTYLAAFGVETNPSDVPDSNDVLPTRTGPPARGTHR